MYAYAYVCTRMYGDNRLVSSYHSGESQAVFFGNGWCSKTFERQARKRKEVLRALLNLSILFRWHSMPINPNPSHEHATLAWWTSCMTLYSAVARLW